MTHFELCRAAAVEYFANVRGKTVEPEPFGYGDTYWADPNTGEFVEVFAETPDQPTDYDFAHRGA